MQTEGGETYTTPILDPGAYIVEGVDCGSSGGGPSGIILFDVPDIPSIAYFLLLPLGLILLRGKKRDDKKENPLTSGV